MKTISIRNSKAFVTGGIAIVAIMMFIMAVIAPDAMGQIPRVESFSNSPLGVACAFEHVVTDLLR